MSRTRGIRTGLITGWVVLVIGISSIPFVVGHQHSTRDRPFTGHVNSVPMDHCGHLAWAKQAYEGRILLANKFNGSDIETRLVFNALFLLIGWLGRLTGLPLVVSFHVVRLVTCVLLLCVIYQFVSLLFKRPLVKWIALALVSTSAGFGWLEMIEGPIRASTISTDTYRPFSIGTVAVEVSTFWHMRWEVVTTPTVLLLLTVFWLGLRFFETDSTKDALGAAAAALGLGVVHPHNLFTVYLVFFLYTIIQSRPLIPFSWRRWRMLLLVFGFSAPALAYHWYVIQQEPLLWSYINLQDHFELLPLLFGYGLPGIFALVGSALIILRGQRELYFPVLWAACALAMLYFPVPPLGQVFALDGLHVAICCLATVGVMWPIDRLRTRLERKGLRATLTKATIGSLLVLFVSAAAMTNILRLVNECVLATGRADPPFLDPFLEGAMANFGYGIGEGKPASPYFMPRELVEAFDWLDKNTDQSKVVLAPAYLSCFIPYQAGNRVYYGHGDLTVNAPAKRQQIDLFYRGAMSRPDRYAFLAFEEIGYILFHSARPLSDRDVARIAENMQQELPVDLVYHNRRVLVYQVFPEPGE